MTELARDAKYLGAQIGFFSLLHTWSQDLHYHPHIHCVVLAGGLTKQQQWRMSSKKFFLPVKVLARKFRGKFLHYLKQYYRNNQIAFYGSQTDLQHQAQFRKLLHQCYAKQWYTYTKRTFSGPLAVVRYLGRYTHRIAIANSRIIAMDENTVTISVRNQEQGNRPATLTMSGVEFIRRFLMHVLPRGFVKIRHYGLLANRNKQTKLGLIRKITHSPEYTPRFAGLSTLEILCLLLGKDVTCCPVCKTAKLFPIDLPLPEGASP